MHFWELKLHGIGFYRPKLLPKIDILQIEPSSEHDLQAQRQILENMSGVAVFADKAFCDKDLERNLVNKKGKLLTQLNTEKDNPLKINSGTKLLMIYIQLLSLKLGNQLNPY